MKDKIAINYTHTLCYYHAAFHSTGMSICRYTTCVNRGVCVICKTFTVGALARGSLMKISFEFLNVKT